MCSMSCLGLIFDFWILIHILYLYITNKNSQTMKIKTKDLVIIPRASYSESDCIALIETNLNYWYYFVERGDIFITTNMSEKALEVFREYKKQYPPDNFSLYICSEEDFIRHQLNNLRPIQPRFK